MHSDATLDAPLHAPANWLDRLARRLVLGRLADVQWPLEIRESGAGGESVVHGAGRDAAIRMTVLDGRFWRAVLIDGTNGAADAYTAGWWTTNDLSGLVRLLCRFAPVMRSVDGGLGALLMPFHMLRHQLRPNTRDGARDNIHAHYDLGNAFFRRWLDPTMLYSSAWFNDATEPLIAAQQRKLDHLFDALDLQPGEHLVEIGTGWGELALRAAQARGARVTTVTISTEQHRLASERIAAAGLAERVSVRLMDYRDLPSALTGPADKLVSVEMVEAIGHRQYGTFFSTISRLLKPTGAAVIQAITIRDQEFARAARESDFIKRHIFPGSCIPSPTTLLAAATRASDLNLVRFQDFAPHYALTLERWREAFHRAADDLRRDGYDDRFQRQWDFYLAYCAGGFAERAIGVAHLLLAKPGWRSREHQRIAGRAPWE